MLSLRRSAAEKFENRLLRPTNPNRPLISRAYKRTHLAFLNRSLELTRAYLTKVAVSEAFGGWETLYQDPADLRFWELTYPHGEMHGGGPPTLKSLTVQEAKSKYRV